MKTFVTFTRRLVTAGGWLAGFLLLATTLLISVEIILRMLGSSTQIAEEYSGYFLAAIVYIGAAYTLQKGEHIRVEVLRERLGEAAAKWLERFVVLVGLVFASLLVYAFFTQFSASLARGSRSFMPSRTPLAVPHAAILLGAALLWLEFFALTLEAWFLPTDPSPELEGA